jgi:uncharacterized protein
VSAPRLTDQLCLRCGLCCNGVIFGDVELQPGDDPARLTALGVPLKSRGKKTKFPQPCACLDGLRCRIYADRPRRCRTFDCRLLQRAGAGEVRIVDALKIIRATRRHADQVRRLLRQLGEQDEPLSLSKRYQRVMKQPMDLSLGDEVPRRRGRLLLAVHELTSCLGRDFLT